MISTECMADNGKKLTRGFGKRYSNYCLKAAISEITMIRPLLDISFEIDPLPAKQISNYIASAEKPLSLFSLSQELQMNWGRIFLVAGRVFISQPVSLTR